MFDWLRPVRNFEWRPEAEYFFVMPAAHAPVYGSRAVIN
jgi:hypothetical protein